MQIYEIKTVFVTEKQRFLLKKHKSLEITMNAILDKLTYN